MAFETLECSGSHVLEMSWWLEVDTSMCGYLHKFLPQGCGSPGVSFILHAQACPVLQDSLKSLVQCS